MPTAVSDVAAQGNPVQPSNPLALIGSAAQIANEVNQNRLFQAKALAGQYLEQSTGPDGNPDMAGLNKLLQGDSRTRPYAADILGAALQNRTTALSNQNTRLGIAGTMMNNLAADVSSVPEGPDQEAQIRSRVAQGAASGRYSSDFAAQALGGGQLPGGITLPQMAKQLAIQGGNQSQQEAQGMAPITLAQTGGQTSPEAVNPILGTTTPAGTPIAATHDPTQLIDVVDQNTGNKTREPYGKYYDVSGNLKPGMSPPMTAAPQAESRASAVGANASHLASYTEADGSQGQISMGQIQNADGSLKPNVKDAAGNQITDGKGVLQVSLAPESMAMLNTTATNEADRATALETAFEGSRNRKALLDEMAALQGNFRSGPNAAKWSAIVSEYNRTFGTNFDSSPAASQQVFSKIGEQFAAQQRDTLGLPATNAGADAARVASASDEKSPEANLQVLAQMRGNEDAIQRKEATWNYYRQSGGKSYNGFIHQFNGVYDPRAFWEPYMTDLQRKTVFGSMTPEQQAAYNASKAKVRLP